MTDHSPAPGWWLASDGKLYAPELHPSRVDTAAAISTPTHSLQWPGFPEPHGASPAGLPLFTPAGPGGPGARPPGYGPPGPPGHLPAPGYGPVPGTYPTWQPAPTTNGLAIASLVLSIVSLLGLGSILAIIFGFVARGQIARSGGRQKGGGLALAGIIIGFVTLFFALVAIAIPTFLGVQRSQDGIEQLPATPIILGTPIDGTSATPITWSPITQMVDTTLTPTPIGVSMDIGVPHEVEWTPVPVSAPTGPSMPLSADVAVVGGATSNGIGLGCVAPDAIDQFAFFVHRSGQWDVEQFQSAEPVLIDSGDSSAINSSGMNQMAVKCSPTPGIPGSTSLELQVNGTPLADDVVKFATVSWAPSIQMCSCDGPATGSFTDITYYSGSITSTS